MSVANDTITSANREEDMRSWNTFDFQLYNIVSICLNLKEFHLFAHIFDDNKNSNKNNNNNKYIQTHAALTSASVLVVGSNSSTIVDEGTVVQQKG